MGDEEVEWLEREKTGNVTPSQAIPAQMFPRRAGRQHEEAELTMEEKRYFSCLYLGIIILPRQWLRVGLS